MNVEMAYLVGMILGNGEIQRGTEKTTVTIEIPHKTLWTEDKKEIPVYIKSSIIDIQDSIKQLVNTDLKVIDTKLSTKLSFSKVNEEYTMREIIRLICGGSHHSTMSMNPELFDMTTDQKKALLRGIADVTGYIRISNMAYNYERQQHRVYIEIPGNWYMVIDVANMLKEVDVPVESIDFAHPNFRDGNLKKYKEGKTNYWKKEHQVKIFANEFLPIGFNITHKQEALEKYSKQLLEINSPSSTHKYYWEKRIRRKKKPLHPSENDPSIPKEIRGMHFEHWSDLARCLGYGE